MDNEIKLKHGTERRDNNFNSTELSIETSGCEMLESFNSFAGNLSPIPASIVPRKLDFSNFDDNDPPSASPAAFSPPYKRVRALRLFDSPATPKTILEKCSTPSHNGPRPRLLPPRLSCPTGKPSGSSHHLHPPMDEDSALGSLPPDETPEELCRQPRRANINPFTPNGQLINKKKRALSKTPTSFNDLTPEQPAKRLKESNISRYNQEFEFEAVLGSGQFGRVTKCVNRLDGCVYALKRSLRPVAGSAGERSAVYEVYAHAVLGKHPNIVRYYSAWAEDDHMIIQNEYCDGGSLQQLIQDGPLPESELLILLAHIAEGLKYIHSKDIVHMDIKPGNIFVCSAEPGNDSPDDCFDDDDDHQHKTHHRLYKIGDFGHVTCIDSPSVEEGDCRYLPNEVLQEDFTHLTKADIFALGLTLYEAGGGGPLPKNGQLWHDFRNGNLPDLPNCSKEFNQLLKRMVDPDPLQRPSAARILRNPLHRGGNASKAQLRRELAAAKQENQLLTKKLEEAARCIKSLTQGHDSAAKLRTRSRARNGQNDSTRVINEVLQSVSAPTTRSRQKLASRVPFKV